MLSKKTYKSYLLYTFILLFSFRTGYANVVSTVSSPDEKNKIEISLVNGEIYYRVYHNKQLVIKDSKLGLVLGNGNLDRNLQFQSAETKEESSAYTLPVGKRSRYTNHYRESVSSFSRLGNRLDVTFRAYNDGFAFRYTITPDNQAVVAVNSENSSVLIDKHSFSWIQKYSKSYEGHYDKRDWAEILSVAGDQDFGAPVLTRNEDGIYFLITEAATYGTYATSKIVANQQAGHFSYAPVGEIVSAAPLTTPWRTIILGDLPTIVESVLVENLNPDTEIEDISWIVPGRSAWDWGGEDAQNTVGFNIAKQYIDYASAMGWEYFLLDDGWDGSKADYTLQEMTEYARSKSVGLLVWTNHNRFQNDKEQIRQVLQPWKDLGVVGFKADFFEDDRQSMMQKYEKILEVAAELKMHVNFHGNTKPTGIRRRWPNLLTSEGVFGNEMYWAWPHLCPPKHVINLTFTRNVIGSMDYTPGKFASKTGKILTNGSWAQQLALLVAFESGLQCITDNPRNFRNQVFESYLKRLPVTWDETKCLEAEPDSYVTLARRKGNDWYIASLCDAQRELDITLDFVDTNTSYYGYIYKDGDCLSEILVDYKQGLKFGDKLQIPMLKGGGVSIHLSTNPSFSKPQIKKYEAESKANKTLGSKTVDKDNLCSGNMYVSGLGRGIRLTFQGLEAEQAGKHVLQVYYMSEEDRNVGIKINGGDELFYSFSKTQGTSGASLGFQTILVELNVGTNTIEFGNKTEMIPNIDRISLMRLDDGSSSVATVKGENYPQISSEGNALKISSIEPGNASVYSLGGMLLAKQQIQRGDTLITMKDKGLYVVNVQTGSLSTSQKIKL